MPTKGASKVARKTEKKGAAPATPAKEPDKEEQSEDDELTPINPLVLEVEGLRYELDRPPSRNGKKVVISVRSASGGDGAPLVDRVDVFTFRSRHIFSTLVADLFARQVGTVMGHLALLIDQVERTSEQEKKPEVVVLTAARKTAAEKLLVSPTLLDDAAKAMEALGYVGEDNNRRLVYLVATSRLLARPLSGILFAASGSGKSEMLDRVAELTPPESVEFLSRLTPQALYYAGSDHLRHKLVIVDEQAGASEADYSIRTLQSKGYLRLAVPVKGKIESFEARGPIALLSGTTRDDLNPENLSRCLELSLDDSPEQTKRVQEAQRRAWAGEKKTAVDVDLWRDAQRLLEPQEAVIPFAAKLAYPARTTKDRRDNMKLLSLIAAHALLFQRQREHDKEGRLIATVGDYAAIYKLLRPVVDQELEGLSPRAAALYRALSKAEKPEVTRRSVAALLGCSYMSAKRALDELLGQEFLRERGKEKPRHFRLLDGSLLGRSACLTRPEELG